MTGKRKEKRQDGICRTKRSRWLWILELDCLCLVVALNVLAWKSNVFCDWYAARVLPLWVGSYGRLTGLAPFSVGEWMIVLLLVLLALAIVLILPAILARHRAAGRWIRRFYQFLGCLVLPVCLLMTLNCTILYHCTRLTEKVSDTVREQGIETEEDGLPAGYTARDLLDIYELMVERSNDLALQMSRDADGNVMYEEDMWEQAVEYLHGQAERYPRLKGYYPRTKEIRNSWFLSQQYIAGYYFPFSMESNINSVMYIMNKPFTICHELVHIHGYIYEDEANYLAYVACVESGNPMFEYSAYLGVMGYVYRDLAGYVEQGRISADDIPRMSERVWLDSVFLTEEAWDKVEKQSFLNTESVEKATDVAMDASLKWNGVANGIDSYSDVVLLLLEYYAQ